MKTNTNSQFIQVECINCREQVFSLSVDILDKFPGAAFRCLKCSCATLVEKGKRDDGEHILVISRLESAEM